MDTSRKQRHLALALSASKAGRTAAGAARAAMIEHLWKLGALRTERVAAAFGAVDRCAFASGVAPDEVYAATTAVRTKWDRHGHAVSSISAPQVQAAMLEQADVRPGMRVLEIGSGGVNAAMLAELVGETGSVTTMDIDSEITERARRCLDAAGYSRVRVVCGDAERGVSDAGGFDVILVTVGCWDIPPAWLDQLTYAGRLVVPLRMRGITRSLALDRAGDRLVTRSAEVCGFVKAQGDGAHQERMLLLHGDRIGLRFDDDTFPAEVGPLDRVLTTDRVDAWSGVRLAGTEPFDSLPLWLATVLPRYCLLTVDGEYDPVADGGPVLADEGGRWFPSATVECGDTVAYLASRRQRPGVFELGAHAFGPHSDQAAARLAEHICVWDRNYRRGPDPGITLRPRADVDGKVAVPAASTVIDKRHTSITISWPAPAV